MTTSLGRLALIAIIAGILRAHELGKPLTRRQRKVMKMLRAARKPVTEDSYVESIRAAISNAKATSS